jgi:uncharacterized protein
MTEPGDRPELPAADVTPRESVVRVWLAPIGTGLVLGVLGCFGARATGMPLPNLLGPAIVCGIATIAGVRMKPLPWSRELGQMVVGLAIGLRVVPSVIDAILGLLPAILISTVGVVAVTMAAGLILRTLCHLDRETAFFGTAAVGLAEMAAVAHDRGGNPAIVSLIHTIRVTAAAGVTTGLLLAAAALGALVLSAATNLSFAASLLALAPAGVTEMVLTASLMHLGVPVITAFHVMRIVLITATIFVLFQVFNTVSKWLDGLRA